MAQNGIDDAENKLAQMHLSPQFMSELAEAGMAQVEAGDVKDSQQDMLAQIFSDMDDGGDDLGDMAQLLGQLGTDELDQLTTMLKGVNDGLTLAQASSSSNDDGDVYDGYF